MLEHDFKIVDVSVNDTNGGSFRLYLQKNKANISSFGSAPFNDVCNFRTASMYAYELDVFEIDNPQTWIDFGKRIDQLRDQTVDFIRKERSRGKSIYGYGASTKGNTLLQYFGLNNDDIIAIAERSPEKFGKYTVGSNIPIIPEDEMRKEKPDYLLILPWHFIREFTHREKKFLDDGGKFIVPCPNFEVIG